MSIDHTRPADVASSPGPSPDSLPGDAAAALHTAVEAWAERAAALGWLTERPSAQRGVAAAADLFDGDERPLVVGLFGGTGVGKSSLLNRIAGQAIARASAERPTSRGVTAYLHRSRQLDALPRDFPVERLHTALHHEPRWRDVLFIDMPDIDSVAAEHREQVVRWLPHLDAVLYVVSPERYRDDRGWQLLREHAHEHAWLFVMNQWDRADARQLDDWRAQLESVGFERPALFRTVATENAASDDDFSRLTDTLERLADRQLIAELDRRGTLARIERVLADARALAGERFGEAAAGLDDRWREHASAPFEALRTTLAGRVPALVVRSAEVGDGSLERSVAAALLDDTARARLDETVTRFTQDERAAQRLPQAVVERLLPPARHAALESLEATAEAAVGQALARPGTRWQRGLHRGARTLTGVLPLAALGWAGWRVLDAFRRGGSDPAAYLGTPFAITAALLIALAWALPWFAARQLAPSRSAALARGLERGAADAIETFERRIGDALQRIDAERRTLGEALDAITARALDRLPERWRGTDRASRSAASEPLDDMPEALRGLLANATRRGAPARADH